MSVEAPDPREGVLDAARALSRRGLTPGTSGNLSARTPEGMWVTPSALAWETMGPDDLVLVDPGGHVLRGGRKPSTEWPLHAAVYRARPDAQAVVHAHATFSTTLATLRRPIPAFHYMVAAAGGDSVRCAPYAPFGSQELAAHTAAALEGRDACLLANHGVVALGATPAAALALLEEVEHLAELYWRALQVGEPALLSEAEMAEALTRFRAYRGGA